MPLDPSIILKGAPPAPDQYGVDWDQINRNQTAQYQQYLRQQDVGGQNALRSLFQDPSALNATTGMPNPGMLGSVYRANPQLGMEVANQLLKYNEGYARQTTTNLLINDKYSKIWDKDIALPVIQRDKELQQQGISQDQRNIMVEQYRSQLVDNALKSNAISDENIANRWQNKKYDPSWQYMSDTYRKRTEEGDKKWEQKFDSDGTPYWTNPFYGITTNQDRTAAYTVKGAPRTAGQEPKERVDVLPDGTRVNIQYDPTLAAQNKNPYTKDGAPYTVRGNVQELGRGGSGADKPVKPSNIKIMGDDGKPKFVPALVYPSAPGAPGHVTDLKGNPIDNAKILDANVSSAIVERPEYSEQDLAVQWGMLKAGNSNAIRAMVFGGPQLRTQAMDYFGRQADEEWGYHLQPGEDPKDPEVKKKIQQGRTDAGINLSLIQDMAQGQNATLAALDKLKGNVQNFEATAKGNIERMQKDLIPVGASKSAPILNRWIRAGRRAIEGDPDVIALDGEMASFVAEYARIMSNPGATGSVTSDTARAEAGKLINSAMTPEAMNYELNVMKGNMDTRISAIDNQITATIDNLRKAGGVLAPLAEPAPATVGPIPGERQPGGAKSGAGPSAKADIPPGPVPPEVVAKLKNYPPKVYGPFPNPTTGRSDYFTKKKDGTVVWGKVEE